MSHQETGSVSAYSLLSSSSSTSSSSTHSLVSIVPNPSAAIHNKGAAPPVPTLPTLPAPLAAPTTPAPPAVPERASQDEPATLSSTLQKKLDQCNNNSQSQYGRAIQGKSSLWSTPTTYSAPMRPGATAFADSGSSSHLNDTASSRLNNNNGRTNSFGSQIGGGGITTTRTTSGGVTTTTIVFDFRGKNVKPNVAVQPRMFGLADVGQHDKNAYLNNGDMAVYGTDNNNTGEGAYHDDGSIDYPLGDSRHNVIFEGDNVIVNNGSLLNKRNKQVSSNISIKNSLA